MHGARVERIGRPRAHVLPAVLGGGVAVVDGLTKLLARRLGEPILLFPHVTIRAVENVRGPFASLPLSVTIGVSAVVLLVIASAYRRTGALSRRVGLAFVIAGGLSNLFERFVFGRTTDVLALPGGSAWNVADAAVLVGAAVVFRHWLRGRRSRPTPPGRTRGR